VSDAKEKADKQAVIREEAEQRRAIKRKAVVEQEKLGGKKQDETKPWKKSKEDAKRVQSNKISSSTPVVQKDFILNHEPRKYLVVKPGQWHEDVRGGLEGYLIFI